MKTSEYLKPYHIGRVKVESGRFLCEGKNGCGKWLPLHDKSSSNNTYCKPCDRARAAGNNTVKKEICLDLWGSTSPLFDGRWLTLPHPERKRLMDAKKVELASEEDGVVVTPEAPVAQPWRNEEFDKSYAPTRNYFRKLDRKHDSECKAGYVYLASNGRCVKIGESVNPDRRTGQANTWALPGEEWSIVTAWYVEDRKKAEKDMHEALKPFNLRLELFELNEYNDIVWYATAITLSLERLDHVKS